MALCLLSFFLVVYAEEPDISGRSAIVIDAETGLALYEKNADEPLPMASTTKIITAITALEHGRLNDIVTVSARAAYTEGSSVWLEEGEQLTLEELLYALMLESGNDAAVAIAEHVGGTVEEFVVMMNELCTSVGAKNTQCVTVNGLDAEGHKTTARDLANIAAYAMKSDTFRTIVGTQSYTIPWAGKPWGRQLENHNKLLASYDGCDGIKTGYTKKSGRCLVSSAGRGDFHVIAVTLSAPDDWQDHRNMLDYAFANFSEKKIYMAGGERLGEMAVTGSKRAVVPYGLADDVQVRGIQPIAATYKVEINKEKVLAPIAKGDVIGTATISFSGGLVKHVSLIALEEAPRDDMVYVAKENWKTLIKTLLFLMR